MQKQIKKALKQYFGYEKFRHGQAEIILSILEGHDTTVIMPTGGGKSICYQLPAILSNGCAIVISPLIALMQDQANVLREKEIAVAIINSSVDYQEINNTLQNAINGAYKLIYIAPERLESRSFIEKLQAIDISFIAVDEAHCISHWGHDFRPSYKKIADIFDLIGEKPVIALTATATEEVVVDIEKSLLMNQPNRFIRGFDRENLSYTIIDCESGREDKNAHLISVAKKHQSGSMIIYCGSRKRVEDCRQILNDNQIEAEHYHAGLTAIIRKSVQNRFITGATKIIVATNAFGMGIDKADVRKVIHYDMPTTIEAYYQEAGRAGRDGQKAECILLYSNKDLNLQHFFCTAGHPTYGDLKMVFQTIEALSGRDGEYYSTNIEYDIATKTELPGYTVSNIIEILLKNGIMVRKSVGRGLYVSLIQEKPRLREFYDNLEDEKQEALKAILKSLPNETFYEKTKLDVLTITREYGISEKNLKIYLRDFALSGMLMYNQNDYEAAVYSIKNDDLDNIRNIAETQTERRQLAYKKLYLMTQLAETPECKRNFILDYFGDKHYSEKCGRCTSCATSQKEKQNIHKLIDLEIKIIHTIKKNKGIFLWREIVNKFTKKAQKPWDTIITDDENKNQYKKNMVNTALTYLFRKRIVEAEERFDTALYLTEFGIIIFELTN